MATLSICMFMTLLMSSLVIFSVHGELSPGFYTAICPGAEEIVSQAVKAAFLTNPTIAPGLLRMHFHDCFVRGCDGSVLLSGNNSERTAIPNLTLRGFEVIEDAKTQLERLCPGVVSCADILALAARDSVVMTGGTSWEVPLGRRDGLVSVAADANNLPSPREDVSIQKRKFSALGLDVHDLVALVGAHTIGTAGCGTFQYRLFNSTTDPAIDPSLLAYLKRQCPLNRNTSSVRVDLDPRSGGKFDLSYYQNLRRSRGVLQSDQFFWSDPTTRGIVEHLMSSETTFTEEFGRAMIKMSSIGVVTGANGEIRKVCSATNN